MPSRLERHGSFSSGSFREMFVKLAEIGKMQFLDLVAQLDRLVLAKSIIVLGSAFVVSGMVFLLPDAADKFKKDRDLR